MRRSRSFSVRSIRKLYKLAGVIILTVAVGIISHWHITEYNAADVIQAEHLLIEPDMGRQPILMAIAHAQQQIHLVIYEISDDDILQALQEACERGVKLHVLVEAHPHRAPHYNQYALQRLQQVGANIRYANPHYFLTHQKTLVIDNVEAVIMTFNLTPADFKNSRNFAVLVRDGNMIREILQTFAADSQRKVAILKHSKLVWSPEQTRARLTKLLEQARHSIDLYALELKDRLFVAELIAKAKQGVQVRILMPHVMYRPQRRFFNYLQRQGITVRFLRDYFIHAKVIIIDDNFPISRAYVGSANISQTSFDRNRELGILLDDTQQIKRLAQIFQYDWRHARLEQVAKYAKKMLH